MPQPFNTPYQADLTTYAKKDATQAALDLKAPIVNPTFTTGVTTPAISTPSITIYDQYPNPTQVRALTFNGWNGNSSTASKATSIDIASDDTNGSYHLLFNKSTALVGGNSVNQASTNPITYNPSTGALTVKSVTPSTANTYSAGTFPAAGQIGYQLTGTNNATSIPVGANNIALYTMANVPAGVYIISANTYVNTSPGLEFRIMRGAVEVATWYSIVGNITAALTAIDTNTTTSTYQLQVYNNGAACTLATNVRHSFFEFVRIA